MESILAVRNLIKNYPGITAVNGVSFAIKAGTCFGLLGPNGAGKTTTIEIMEGLIKPTGGEVLYKGATPGRDFRNEVGIQFQSTALQDFLTTQEVLQLFRSFYNKTLPIPHLVEMCSLGEFLHRDNRKLSGGQRQRLFLALALVNDPEILFLDEPTTGLDPQARQNFWHLIEDIKQQNKTIVLTTHYMEEADVLCDEIAIMDQGKIIAEGTPRHLLDSHFKGAWLEVPTRLFSPPADFPWQWVQLQEMVSIKTSDSNRTIQYLIDQGIALTDLRVKSPTLEDLFLELTGRDLRN